MNIEFTDTGVSFIWKLQGDVHKRTTYRNIVLYGRTIQENQVAIGTYVGMLLVGCVECRVRGPRTQQKCIA